MFDVCNAYTFAFILLSILFKWFLIGAEGASAPYHLNHRTDRIIKIDRHLIMFPIYE